MNCLARGLPPTHGPSSYFRMQLRAALRQIQSRGVTAHGRDAHLINGPKVKTRSPGYDAEDIGDPEHSRVRRQHIDVLSAFWIPYPVIRSVTTAHERMPQRVRRLAALTWHPSRTRIRREAGGSYSERVSMQAIIAHEDGKGRTGHLGGSPRSVHLTIAANQRQNAPATRVWLR